MSHSMLENLFCMYMHKEKQRYSLLVDVGAFQGSISRFNAFVHHLTFT